MNETNIPLLVAIWVLGFSSGWLAREAMEAAEKVQARLKHRRQRRG